LSNGSKKSQLVVVRKSPYGSTLARAALDASLAAAAFDQAVNLLFLGDGVLQLLPGQDSAVIDKKSIGKLIASLPLYDIESIYVDATALTGYALTVEDLPQSLQLLDEPAIRALMADHHHLLSF
jgi:tRNA 2-thiouridine synthesizing protein C